MLAPSTRPRGSAPARHHCPEREARPPNRSAASRSHACRSQPALAHRRSLRAPAPHQRERRRRSLRLARLSARDATKARPCRHRRTPHPQKRSRWWTGWTGFAWLGRLPRLDRQCSVPAPQERPAPAHHRAPCRARPGPAHSGPDNITIGSRLPRRSRRCPRNANHRLVPTHPRNHRSIRGRRHTRCPALGPPRAQSTPRRRARRAHLFGSNHPHRFRLGSLGGSRSHPLTTSGTERTPARSAADREALIPTLRSWISLPELRGPRRASRPTTSPQSGHPSCGAKLEFHRHEVTTPMRDNFSHGARAGTLNTAVEKLWGFVSERGRRMREDREELSAQDAELVIHVIAALVAYLAGLPPAADVETGT